MSGAMLDDGVEEAGHVISRERVGILTGLVMPVLYDEIASFDWVFTECLNVAILIAEEDNVVGNRDHE
jgi:hypothetical protein